jgi:hypothetical protein
LENSKLRAGELQTQGWRTSNSEQKEYISDQKSSTQPFLCFSRPTTKKILFQLASQPFQQKIAKFLLLKKLKKQTIAP